MPLRIVILTIALAVATYTLDTARGQDMKLLEYHCQDHSHEPKSDAEKACDDIYEFLRDHAADPGYDAKKHVMINDDNYYGEAACNRTLTQDACTKCIGVAYEFTIKECIFSDGAQVKFGSCRFRVDNYAFYSNW